MTRHASMNRAYRLIWSTVRNVWIPVAEKTRGRGKRVSGVLIAATLALGASIAQASGPTGGQVTAGTGSIAQSGTLTTITQASPKLSLSWSSFNIPAQDTVDFVQPSASAIAVNRILDTNGTQILGHLTANGQVYLINPNGILFGPGAELNVGGLVATTLEFNGADGNTTSFSGNSASAVVNEGTINAGPGGYVALLASHVSNQGVISAQLGSVALAAGSAATLTFSNNNLVRLQVDQSALHALAENGGLMRADGGQVLMSAGARDALVASVVNNTGVIEARTVDTHDGTIILQGGITAGTVKVGGTLDASAPDGSNGGFIETSAAHVEVETGARVSTAAASGQYGSWLIDPNDYTVAAIGGDMTGVVLSTSLGLNNVILQSSQGGTAGSGNVNVDDAVTWSANTSLTLTASNNVNINANITATGNTAGLVINPNTANGAELASGAGIYTLQRGVSIRLPGSAPTLSIAGSVYTVLNTLGAEGSTTGSDLQGINGGLAGHYALGSNIDASPSLTWNAGTGFAPIGTLTTPFTGTFDGLGHTISDLTISLTTPNVGLFGATGTGAAILNVGLVGGSVTGGAGTGGLVGNNGPNVPISDSYATVSVNGAAGAGGLVGTNTTGAITQSYATGSVNGAAGTGGLIGSNTSGAVSDSYATGSVSGAAGTGGLVGSSTSGAISKSFATGSVNGAAGTGGLIGSNTSGAISDSDATGNVDGGTGAGVGGLIGSNTSGTVHNTYAAGGVSGTGASVGALLGSSNTGVVTDSYWNTTTSLVQGSAGGGIGMTSAQMMAQANFVSATTANSPDNPSWNFAGTWMMYEGLTYPLLSGSMTPLTVTANNTIRIYGQANPAFSVSYSTTPDGNLLGTVAYSGTAQGAANVGSYVIAPGGLYSNQGGYIISYANGTLTIDPAPLTVSGLSGTPRNYNGSVIDTLTGTGTLAGLVSGETLTLGAATTGTLGSANAGSEPITTALTLISGSGLAANYVLTQPALANVIIGQAPLTVSGLSGTPRNYNGSVIDTLTGTGTLAGLVSGETLTLGAATTGTLGSANAGSEPITTALTLISGSGLAANYVLTQPALANVIIGQAPLTVSGLSGTPRNYNGSVIDTLTGTGTLAGLVSGETLTLGAATTGTLGSANAGSEPITTALTLISGSGLAANYVLTQPALANVTIVPASLTVIGSTAGDKVYDGTYSAVLTGGSLSGVIGSDGTNLILAQAGLFASKNVGSGIGVTASDTLGGTSAGNYTLSEPTGLTGSITPAMLTYTAAAATFTVGQTPSGLSGTLSGFVLADNQTNTTAGTLVWTTTAVAGSQAGRYAIDGGGLTAANYVFIEAPGDAVALTLLSGSSPAIPPVMPPVIPPVMPPVIPPVMPPVIPHVIPPLSGPDAATLAQAQTAAGALETNLPASQTCIPLALPVLTRDVGFAQSADSDQGAVCSHVSSDGIVIDKRVVINALVPSLRIVRGGVKLPENAVDVNAL